MPDLIAPPAAERPHDVPLLLSQAVSDGDLDAAVALYEPGAILVLWNDTSAVHPAAVRAALASVLSEKVPFRSEAALVRTIDDLALLACRWQLRGSGSSPQGLYVSGWQHSLVRRSPNDGWRFVVDTWTQGADANASVSREHSLALPIQGLTAPGRGRVTSPRSLRRTRPWGL